MAKCLIDSSALQYYLKAIKIMRPSHRTRALNRQNLPLKLVSILTHNIFSFFSGKSLLDDDFFFRIEIGKFLLFIQKKREII